jgi:hypothetical protein
VFSVPLIGFNMTAINMLVACEDGSSFFEKGRVKKEFIGKDLVTAAVLHRGLISGQEIDKAVLVGGYCSCFCSSSIGGSRYPAGRAGSSLNS